MLNSDLLHGVKLETILTRLLAFHSWEGLYDRIPINCFGKNPSIKSSLTFLRKTPWAREKVENLYCYLKPEYRTDDPPQADTKKILSIVLFFILIMSQAGASEVANQKTVAIAASMQTALKLTSTQLKSIAPLLMTYFNQIEKMKAQLGENSSLLPQKIKYLRDDLDSNLAHYLTEEQMAAWQKQMPSGGTIPREVKASAGERKIPMPISDGVLQSGKSKQSGVI